MSAKIERIMESHIKVWESLLEDVKENLPEYDMEELVIISERMYKMFVKYKEQQALLREANE